MYMYMIVYTFLHNILLLLLFSFIEELESLKEEAMEVEEDYAAVMSDPAFLQSVLENLPGVDPHSEAVRQAVGSLQQNKDKDKEKEKEKEKDKEKDKEKK